MGVIAVEHERTTEMLNEGIDASLSLTVNLGRVRLNPLELEVSFSPFSSYGVEISGDVGYNH